MKFAGFIFLTHDDQFFLVELFHFGDLLNFRFTCFTLRQKNF